VDRTRSLASLLTAYQAYLDKGGLSPEEFVADLPAAPSGAPPAPETLDALRAVTDLRNGAGAPLSNGASLGPYRIVRELGRGAQATVFLATDTRLGREVALKILQPPRGREAIFYLRFLREAETASRLDHRGICSVYEADVADGHAFIAMRYIDGETLRGPLAAQPSPDRDLIAQRARLVEEVARALHVAHERGVVHRDIKPANIMLDSEGAAVLCDFGLVHEESAAGLTRTGEVAGTPAYMAPEQMRGQHVDRRTDVYALGVVLYELLTGRRPFDGATWVEFYRLILHTEPTAPRKLNREIPVELEAVVLTALDKDPARRYATAQAFADDLRRVRRHEPVLARRPGPLLRARRWAQRHPAKAIALIALVGGTLAFTLQQQGSLRSIGAAKAESDRLREHAERETYRTRIAAADASLKSYDAGEARRQLDLCDPGMRGCEWHYLKRGTDTSRFVLPAHGRTVHDLALAPDGKSLVTASEDKTIVIWDLPSGRRIRTIDVAPGEKGFWARPLKIALSPDGALIAEGNETGTVRVWSARNGKRIRTLGGLPRPNRFVRFRAGGKQLVTAGSRDLQVFDIKTGRCVARVPGVFRTIVLLTEDRFLAGTEERTLVTGRLFGTQVHTVATFDTPIRTVTAGPGDRVLVGLEDGEYALVDVPTGRELVRLRGHEGIASGAMFLDDGAQALTAAHDATIRRWDLKTGRLLATQIGHAGYIEKLVAGPRGDSVWTCSLDGTVRAWDTRPRRAAQIVWKAHANLETVAFSPDGLRIATGGWSPIGRVLDVVTHDVVAILRGHEDRLRDLAFSPDGTRIASASSDGTVRIWDSHSGAELARLLGHTQAVHSVAYSADGTRIASGGRDRTVRIWEAARAHPVAIHTVNASVNCVRFLNDGRVAAAVGDGTVRILGGHDVVVLRGHGAPVSSLAVHGHCIASGDSAGTIRIWDLRTGTCERVARGHIGNVASLAFHPAGRRLLSGGRDQVVRLWSVERGEPVLALRGNGELIHGVAFSANGARFASAGFDNALRLWEFESPAGYAAELRHRGALADTVRPIVDGLFHEFGFSLDVAAHLPTMTADQRNQALRMIRAREEDPGDLSKRAWAVLLRPDATAAEYRRALVDARRARLLQPGSGTLLGAALYRTGTFNEARRVLERREEHFARDPRWPRPDNTAFFVMALKRLGLDEEADAAFARGRDPFRRHRGPTAPRVEDAVPNGAPHRPLRDRPQPHTPRRGAVRRSGWRSRGHGCTHGRAPLPGSAPTPAQTRRSPRRAGHRRKPVRRLARAPAAPWACAPSSRTHVPACAAWPDRTARSVRDAPCATNRDERTDP